MRLALLALLLVAAAAAALRLRAGPPPLDLAYEVDLAGAGAGRLDVTLRVGGRPPRALRLVRPGGLFHDAAGGSALAPLAAWSLTRDGGRGGPLELAPDGRAWSLRGADARGAVVQYRVALPADGRPGDDIRAHLTARSGGGFRAAGFHLFLVPESARVGALTVRFAGAPAGPGARLAAPWPAAGAPDGIVYAPRDLRDLTDAVVAWGDLRLHEQEVGGCALRLAVRGEWAFADAELARLLARLGRAEVEFFGGPPHASMLVLVDRNPLAGGDFPYYGLHVGHSVLLLLDPDLGWTDLEDKAASVAAHEMFHGWLGEEIRQEGGDLNWFVEGVTSWCTARVLVESGVWTAARAEEVVGGRVDQHYAGSPLRGRESIAAAARGLLRDGETTRYAYAGGTLAAWQLDAWLSAQTGRRHPLDDVLRDLFARRADGPLTRMRLEAALRRAGGRGAGGWLERHVYGTEPLPRPVPMF